MNEFEQRIFKTIIRAMELTDYENELNSIEDIEKEVEINSLAVLEILVTLEEEFGICLEEDEINADIVKDIHSLAKIISNNLEK